MSLAKEIIKEAEAEAKAILKEAEEEESSKLDELRASLSSKKEEELSKLEEELKRKVVEETSKARLMAKKILEQKKEELFKKALDEAVDVFLKSDAYKHYLREAAQRVWEELGADAEIHINEADKDLINEGNVILDLQDRGLKGVSKDGRVALDFTLSSLIASKEDKLRAAFYQEV